MSDPTNTQAAHPSIVTATGAATPPAPTPDPTGTDAQHPSIVSRPGSAAQTA
jgi:hypothetical protein